jgi:hypothetical protein
MKKRTISERTLEEQAAGRKAIFPAVQKELLEKGDRELAAKFKTYMRNPHLVFNDETHEWEVAVCLRSATGSIMELTTSFLGFPSDLLITQMMLVEP